MPGDYGRQLMCPTKTQLKYAEINVKRHYFIVP